MFEKPINFEWMIYSLSPPVAGARTYLVRWCAYQRGPGISQHGRVLDDGEPRWTTNIPEGQAASI